MTKDINDLEFRGKQKNLNLKKINILSKKIKDFKQIDIINKNHNLKFLNELKVLLNLLLTV